MKAVALFGGTFNPIHYGHLSVAEEIRIRLGLDKVLFIPTHTPPHKVPEDLVDSRQRCLMATLATVSNPAFEVSTFEADRVGKSYSIDTVRHYREVFGVGTEIYFIIGADMLQEVPNWRNAGELFGLCRFVAVPRPGYDVRRILDRHFMAATEMNLVSGLLDRIQVEDVSLMDISATDIRKRVKGSKSIKYLVPEPVEQYILHQKLYL
jgi:nicotinate-nucleotide adenylyltransferase